MYLGVIGSLVFAANLYRPSREYKSEYLTGDWVPSLYLWMMASVAIWLAARRAEVNRWFWRVPAGLLLVAAIAQQLDLLRWLARYRYRSLFRPRSFLWQDIEVLWERVLQPLCIIWIATYILFRLLQIQLRPAKVKPVFCRLDIRAMLWLMLVCAILLAVPLVRKELITQFHLGFRQRAFLGLEVERYIALLRGASIAVSIGIWTSLACLFVPIVKYRWIGTIGLTFAGALGCCKIAWYVLFLEDKVDDAILKSIGGVGSGIGWAIGPSWWELTAMLIFEMVIATTVLAAFHVAGYRWSTGPEPELILAERGNPSGGCEKP